MKKLPSDWNRQIRRTVTMSVTVKWSGQAQSVARRLAGSLFEALTIVSRLGLSRCRWQLPAECSSPRSEPELVAELPKGLRPGLMQRLPQSPM
jgi:hypothetical protein